MTLNFLSRSFECGNILVLLVRLCLRLHKGLESYLVGILVTTCAVDSFF